MMNDKLKRIYEERKRVYNCTVDTFETEGITILEVEAMRGKNYFTLASFGKHLFLRIDPDMTMPFKQEMYAKDENPEKRLCMLKDYYGTSERTLTKTFCYYYYLKDTPFTGCSDLVIQRATDSNPYALDSFFSHLSEEDLVLADIDVDERDPIIFGGFEGDRMVAYVSHRHPDGHPELGDIGIVIDSEFRGRGFGEAMLRHEVNWCLQNDIIPMYVVLEDNKASVALVEKLGFERICEIYRLK
jgi:ribosomal protein S18 acetylase RimI-like enzyme